MRLRWVAAPSAVVLAVAGLWYVAGPAQPGAPRETHTPGRTLVLRDGRRVGIAEFGDPAGRPVFYFHGFLGSRMELIAGEDVLRRYGVRWIGVDRPGVGLSGLDEHGSYVDWAEDAGEVAEQLGLEKFGVMGWSAGAPLALAVATHLPLRIDRVAIAAPVGAMDVEELRLAAPRAWLFQVRLASWLPGLMARRLQQIDSRRQSDPRRFELETAREQAPADAQILSRDDVVSMMVVNRAEAFRQGTAGLVHDLLLMSRDWGFDYESIRVPVRIWHGEQDRIAPMRNAQYLSGAIPGAEFVPIRDAGHYVALARGEEIIRWLAHR